MDEFQETLFDGYQVNIDKLKELGFIYSEKDQCYFNIFYLYDENFSMYVYVKDNTVYTDVRDIDKNKKYYSFRYLEDDDKDNKFVIRLNKEFYEVLYKIRDVCFVKA